ncbi:MAG: DUF47 family protein [Patescibacteria group bacterium]
MRFFLPKQQFFFKLLRELSEYQKEIADLFVLFAKAPAGNGEQVRQAKEIESNADEKTHEIIEQLNKTLITPLDREDIYALAHELDDIVDLIENVMNNYLIYNIKSEKPVFAEFAGIIKEASLSLDEMIETIADQKNTGRARSLKIKIHKIEDRGDYIFQKELANLFANEQNPVEIIRWKSILGDLERITDKYQHLSNIIEGILIKFG